MSEAAGACSPDRLDDPRLHWSSVRRASGAGWLTHHSTGSLATSASHQGTPDLLRRPRSAPEQSTRAGGHR